jgi:hypothetical protein
MKVKSAFQQSVMRLKIFTVPLAILIIVLAIFPSVILGIITGVTAFQVVGDVINIIFIKWKARRNPEFLEEKIR